MVFGSQYNSIPAPTPRGVSSNPIDRLNANMEKLITLYGPSVKPAYPFSRITIDLTTAHTNHQITNMKPFDYLQVYCDGPLDGITVKMGSQDSAALPLNQMVAIPVPNNPEFMYLTNDVRQGRSSITIYWARGSLLNLARGGQDISLSEVAARLGGINTIDRRGEVIFYENFEKGLSGISVVNFGGYSVATTNKKCSGSNSLKMHAGAVALASYTSFTITIPYIPDVKMGFGFRFQKDSTASPLLRMKFLLYTGVRRKTFDVRYNHNTQLITYEKNGATTTNLQTAYSLPDNDRLFNYIKLVVNPQTGNFDRLMINDKVWDMSLLPGESAADAATLAQAQVFLQLYPAVAVDTICHVDDIAVTMNEP